MTSQAGPPLARRVAIVTGGAKGLGLHYTQALAQAGAQVVIADIAAGDEVQSAVMGLEGALPCEVIQTDVSDEQSVQNLLALTLQKFSRIDILVNNAALYSTLAPVKCVDIDVDLWDRVHAINVRGLFLMVKHVAKVMIAQGNGKIINIGSGVAYKGLPDMLHYAASKGAVVTMTRALARELGEHNICVNTLSPGLTLSDSILANSAHVALYRDSVVKSRSLKRDAYPEDLLGALLFLAGSDSDFYTGQNLVVDGGSVNT